MDSIFLFPHLFYWSQKQALKTEYNNNITMYYVWDHFLPRRIQWYLYRYLERREANKDSEVQMDVDKERGRDKQKEKDIYTDYLYRHILLEIWI